MPLKDHFLEFVIDVFSRRILVGMDFIDYHSLFRFHFVFRESRAGGKFEQQSGSLPQVFLEDGCVENDLFFGCKCVKFASKAFKTAVYDRCTSFRCALEYSVLGEMGYAFMVARFVSCTALDAQGAVCNC